MEAVLQSTSQPVFLDHFRALPDPRLDRTKLHPLFDIIIITICAVICGADGWEAVAEFGLAKYPWLRRFLALPNGIPSHDTFARVFARIDPEQFQSCFLRWMRCICQLTSGEVVPIDGKRCVTPMILNLSNPPFTWSALGRRPIGWCWVK